jgi:hypothetical protein
MNEHSVAARFWFIFFSPRRAMEGVRQKPRWGIPALVILLIMGLFVALTLEITFSERAQLQRDKGHLVSPQTSEGLALLENPPMWLRLVAGVASGAVACVVLALWGLVFLFFSRLSGGAATYGQLAGVVFWAGLVSNGFGLLVRLPLVLAKQSVMSASTGLALLAPNAELGSFLYQFLANFGDVFLWWFLGITITGVAVVNDFRAGKAAAIVLAPWLLISFFFFGLGQLLG